MIAQKMVAAIALERQRERQDNEALVDEAMPLCAIFQDAAEYAEKHQDPTAHAIDTVIHTKAPPRAFL